MKMRVTALLGSILMAVSIAGTAQESIPGPQVGDKFAHDLAALDQHGKQQTLSSLMGEKGAVVFFVRSADWCPYCQRQMANVNERLAEFTALGLSVISVGVDEVAEIAKFGNERQIAYTMLADPAGDINKSLGIRDEQYPVGHNAFGVPRPVLYVIDSTQTVRAVYMEPTYRTRPDLDVVLHAAKALGL